MGSDLHFVFELPVVTPVYSTLSRWQGNCLSPKVVGQKGSSMTNVTVRWFALVMLGVGLILATSGQASAVGVCTTYDSTNGTTTFPGTYVGSVSGTCQIGNMNDPGQGNALVNSDNNPSIYEFQLTTPGLVTILDELGNNGTNAHVGVQLYSLAGAGSTSGTKVGSQLNMPDQLGPTAEFTLFSGDLGAGYYAVDTFLEVVGDPRYQVNITEDSVAAPEPGSLLLLSIGLLALVGISRRRNSGATSAPVLS